MWRRRPAAPAAIRHIALAGSLAQQCRRIGSLASEGQRLSGTRSGEGTRLVAAVMPSVLGIDLHRASHPRAWGHQRAGLVMSSPGRLSVSFAVPEAGIWNLWVQGQLMPRVEIAIDGRAVAAIAGQLSGNSLVPDTVPPTAVRLSSGVHRLWVSRGAITLAPGDGGAAVLDSVFLTPPGTSGEAALHASPLSRWRELCGLSYEWVELSGS